MKRSQSISLALKTIGFAALASAVFAAVLAPARADSTVQVELWDQPDGTQGINLSTDEVKAGKVTFEITNSSHVMEHEFLIVKTDMGAEHFPMKSAGAKVDESKLEGIDEYGDVEEGETESWTTELAPGQYVLFCNEEGHFAAGMHTTFTVTP